MRVGRPCPSPSVVANTGLRDALHNGVCLYTTRLAGFVCCSPRNMPEPGAIVPPREADFASSARPRHARTSRRTRTPAGKMVIPGRVRESLAVPLHSPNRLLYGLIL